MSRYLLNADALTDLNPHMDTGIFISPEILKRGLKLDYCDLSKVDLSKKPRDFLASIPVQEILAGRPGQADFWTLGPTRLANINEYSVILQRKDPPVDQNYRRLCEIYQQAPTHILQINNPHYTAHFSEHELPLRYPDYCAPTRVCEDFTTFQRAVSQFERSVAKPHNTYGGMGITFFDQHSSLAGLERFWEEWEHPIIVQQYIPQIETLGDLRILVFNQKILGSVLRKPKPGSKLANLHQGGSSHFFEPTAKQLAACKAVAADLTPLGIYLIGLDFIGDYLTEVNITCPTLIKQINEVMNKRADIELVDAIELLRKERS